MDSRPLNHPLGGGAGAGSGHASSPSSSPRSGAAAGGDPVQRFLGGAAPASPKLALVDVSHDRAGLHALAVAQSWRPFMQLAEKCFNESQYPAEKLQFRTCRIAAMVRMRLTKPAMYAFNDLGDLDDKAFSYEAYEHIYPGRSGSMVPFTLRLLHAELPHHLGDSPAALDRLYALRARTLASRKSATKAPEPEGLRAPESAVDALAMDTIIEKTDADDNEAAGSDADADAEASADIDTAGTGTGAGAPLVEEHASGIFDDATVPMLDSVSTPALTDDAPAATPPTATSTPTATDDGISEPSTSEPGSSVRTEEEPQMAGSNSTSVRQPALAVLDPVAPLKEVVESQESQLSRVTLSLINLHMAQKEHLVCIDLIEERLEEFPEDVDMLAALMRIYLQLGAIDVATKILARIESLYTDADRVALVRLGRGYLYMAAGQFTTALDQFQLAVQLEPSNKAAVNNMAACCLYCGQLPRAIRVLEDFIRKDPPRNLTETVVYNLCTLYDLASDNAGDQKKVLQRLVIAYGKDDFDPSILRAAMGG